MTLHASAILRRAILAAALAAAATVSSSAVGDPATACAAPREWDIGSYDSCTTRVDNAIYIEGTIAEGNINDAYRECCVKTGGDWDLAKGTCVAPPAEQAQEAERAPVETPFIGPDATLWMPPPVGPVGPVGPPPSEVLLIP